ncbi:hypothetical protein SDC9_125487 [bioreactor metagenome]|uniref:Uncharacterized protein n=1 Tax=bioreactor metagenome TaxID=1076179 RepID=A0A645CN71_9ZZZZ
MDNVLLAATRGNDGARAAVRPNLHVVCRVADDNLLAGCAARRVQAHDVLERYGEHAVGVGVPQILLVGKRQFLEVVDALDIVRRHPRRLHPLAVELNALIHAAHGGKQPLVLQFADLLARSGLDLPLIIVLHGSLLLYTPAGKQFAMPFFTFLFFANSGK